MLTENIEAEIVYYLRKKTESALASIFKSTTAAASERVPIRLQDDVFFFFY